MPVLQDPRLELIAQSLANGSTQTDAYAAAYPNSTKAAAAVSATRMLNDPNKRLVIDGRVSEILREREQARIEAAKVAAKKTGLTKAWVLEQLRTNYERAMQAEPVIRDGEPTGEYRYEGGVANKALELIGKELGMFIERREVGDPGEFAAMSTSDLRAYIADNAHLLTDIVGAAGEAGRSASGDEAPSGGGKGSRVTH